MFFVFAFYQYLGAVQNLCNHFLGPPPPKQEHAFYVSDSPTQIYGIIILHIRIICLSKTFKYDDYHLGKSADPRCN